MSVIMDWMQTVFNIGYMTIVWILVIAMAVRYGQLGATRRRTALWILIAGFTLAFGDSFHLVPRLYRTFSGISLEATPPDLAWWLGFGLFASSFTLSFFYLFLQIYGWRKFDLAWDVWMWLLVLCFLVRVGLLFFPQNDWAGEPTMWKFYRNVPFALQGAGVVWLFLRHAGEQPPAVAHWLRIAAYGVVISFVCYIATLIGTLWDPMWGSLMLFKTMAYVVVAWKLYQVEFQRA